VSTDPLNKDKAEYVVAADGHKYHKSATANAAVAPTNEHTVANASKTAGLSFDQAEFVTVLDYEWNLNRDIDASYVKKEYGYSDEQWQSYVSNPLIIKALDTRGINVLHLVPNAPEVKSKLTPLQLVVANTVLDLADTRSHKKKLQDAGVTTYQYQSWLRNPDFSNYLKERAEGLIGDVQHEALLALVDRVQSGDMKAIEYYHEMTGRFVRDKGNNNSTSNHDLQGMIVRIIEIIVDEVHDQETALRISDRLKGLVTGAQVAGILPPAETTIEQPPIAAAREMTPEVKAMMEQGVGYDS
jgi:hypothetical protein